MTIWIIFIGVMIMSWLVSNKLKRKFKKYSKIPVGKGLTGHEIVKKMLHDNGIYDVSIKSVSGQLTDHYNPATRSINLSREVYHGSSVASAAVAAHECGHALQHANAYSWLGLRSKLVPAVSFASKWVHWVLLAGILMVESRPEVLLAGIGLFTLTTLFSVITLPVEINASKRALAWLSDSGITTYGSHEKAEDALRWASYTYVIAALGSIAALLYYVMIFLGVSD